MSFGLRIWTLLQGISLIKLSFRQRLLLQLVLLVLPQPVAFAQEVRIKDLAQFRGDRSNSLMGFGLVIGLSKTGDTPEFAATNKALGSVFQRLGFPLDNPQVATQSAAAVAVTADLPAFAQVGDRIDLRVSTLGNASSLAGGTLLVTQLKGLDGETYVVGEGAILVGQATGKNAKTLTVARIPNGGMIERSFQADLVKNGKIELFLREPDFTTSERLAEAINVSFRHQLAEAHDASLISVLVPQDYAERLTPFLSIIEGLRVEADQKSKVIINERTGTIVMGGDVKISPVVISHNGLSIEVGSGKTAKKESLVPIQGSTVGELIKSLNQMGVKPEDMVSILQSLSASGALRAELKIL